MKKNSLYFLIALTLMIFVNACSKDSSSTKVEDEYYIKYEIISNASPYTGVKLNTSFINEKNETNLITHNTGTWETTIGPVKKGFGTYISTTKNNWSGAAENHLRISINIYTSKNGSPFAIKKYDNITTARANAKLGYTVE